MPRRWEIRPPDKALAERLARELEIHPLTSWVLLNRGISEPEAGRRFLNPSLDQLRPEPAPHDMDRAVARLAQALENQELIGIHGDYDVDGVAGTALLAEFFTALGGRVISYLPHRQREGYGLKPAAVEALKAKGADLLVTVDCGTTDRPALEHARELGLPVIVVDHHQVPESLPPADAIVNPHRDQSAGETTGRTDSPVPYQELSAAGLVYVLLLVLRAHLRQRGFFQNRDEPNLRACLDLAALGTIADVVPLVGLNRLLVTFGLEKLNSPERIGLRMLSQVAGVNGQKLSAGKVAFTLVPRLNAPGRLDHAGTALRLLLSREMREARELAEELNRMNATRQRVEERILAEALEQVEGDPRMLSGQTLVAAGKGWHPGVIGIVASRLVDRFSRPVAVISLQDGVGKGSLRSIPGCHVYRALTECAPALQSFGGHAQAAGLTLAEAKLPEFRERFEAAVRRQSAEEDFTPRLRLDAEWPLTRLNERLVKELARLEPYGMGNPEPVFAARGVIVVQSQVRNDKHLFLVLREKEVNLEAWAFGQAEQLPAPGDLVDVAYTPELNRRGDREYVRIRVKDLHVV